MIKYFPAALTLFCFMPVTLYSLPAQAAEKEFRINNANGAPLDMEGSVVNFLEREFSTPVFHAALPDGVSTLLGCYLLEKRLNELHSLSPGVELNGNTVNVNASHIERSLRVSRNMAWSNGKLYVAEEASISSTRGCISVIGLDGSVARRYPTVAHPHAVAVRGDTLWVAGATELAALHLPSAKELFRVPLPPLCDVTQLALLADSLYVGDRHAPAVRLFNAQTGADQGIIIGADQLTMHADLSGIGLAVTITKTLLVSDSVSVREFSTKEAQATLLRKIVDVPGGSSLAVDSAGNIAVAVPRSLYPGSPPTPEVWKFDATGKPLARFVRIYMRGPADFDGKQPDSLYKLRVFGGLLGSIRSPGGVAFDDTGRLYVSDTLRWPRSATEYYSDDNQLQMDGGVVRFSAQSELEARLGSRYSDGEIARARLIARAKRAPFLRTATALKTGKLSMLCWGDSITACGGDWNGGASMEANNWGHVLARNLEGQQPGLKVVETLDGVGGQNVAESLCRDPAARATRGANLDLVLIQLGTNDQVFRLTTPAQFADSLRKMLTQLLVVTDSDLVLVSPGPLPKSIVLTQQPPAVYLETMKKVGAEFHVPVVDISSGINSYLAKTGKPFTDLHMGPENCHPNDAGHAEWAKIVTAAVEQGVKKEHSK